MRKNRSGSGENQVAVVYLSRESKISRRNQWKLLRNVLSSSPYTYSLLVRIYCLGSGEEVLKSVGRCVAASTLCPFLWSLWFYLTREEIYTWRVGFIYSRSVLYICTERFSCNDFGVFWFYFSNKIISIYLYYFIFTRWNFNVSFFRVK